MICYINRISSCLDKSDLNFGRAQGAAKLALELSIITADQFVVYVESLIWERNNA